MPEADIGRDAEYRKVGLFPAVRRAEHEGLLWAVSDRSCHFDCPTLTVHGS
jgi:hypothetical protein